MLGILKSGAAYVPLDHALPLERLRFMIEDSELEILVSSSTVIAQLPPHRLRTVLVDHLPARQFSNNTFSPPDADSLCYVRYTSGSTGRPKGVAIPNRALLNFLLSMQEKFEGTPRDVLLAVTTLAFDISELEIWLPLISGSRIILATTEQAIDGVELARLIEENDVTMMQATPATWRLMVDCGCRGNRRLKILCGGEALRPQLAAELLKRCGELWNMYGPTETTVWSTCTQVASVDEIHIGTPIANTEI